jgi:ubiquinone/menaquinone biosynthesis C-methylase UbiE
MPDFNQTSYDLHEKHFAENFSQEVLDGYKKKDTVDYWRHENMYSNLLPLIEAYPDARWLTIGDGRYGTDANYLLSHGMKQVMATDISDTFLKIAKAEGFISDYQVENAEKLSFGDASFDFVLCKESYHHFPRPAVALYEMLRVAKRGIVLIEPMDKNINFSKENIFTKSIRGLINTLQLQLKGIHKYENFEEVGNYIFTTSERELNKIALALNLHHTYYKKQNDHFIPGAENEKLASHGPLFQKISSKIRRLDMLSKLGVIQYGLLTSIIAKEKFTNECIGKMKSRSFDSYDLPVNPYLT